MLFLYGNETEYIDNIHTQKQFVKKDVVLAALTLDGVNGGVLTPEHAALLNEFGINRVVPSITSYYSWWTSTPGGIAVIASLSVLAFVLAMLIIIVIIKKKKNQKL